MPRRYATGTLASMTARPRSAAMSSRRLWVRRSTQAPTNSAPRFGSQTAAVSTPTWTADAPSMVTAINGPASSVTRSPNWDTVSPIHSARKRRFRHSDGTGAGISSVVPVMRSPPAAGGERRSAATEPDGRLQGGPGAHDPRERSERQPTRSFRVLLRVGRLGQRVPQEAYPPCTLGRVLLGTPHERGDQLLDVLLELPQLVLGEQDPGVAHPGQHPPLRLQPRLVPQQPLLRQVAVLREHLRLEGPGRVLPLGVGRHVEPEAPGRGLPPPVPLAGGPLPVLDQLEAGQVAKVPAHHRGRRPDVRGELGGGGRAEALQPAEDGQPYRVGQRPQRLRVGDLVVAERILERHVSRLVSQVEF